MSIRPSVLPALALLAATLTARQEPVDPAPSPLDTAPELTTAEPGASWTLQWDDRVDGALEIDPHECAVYMVFRGAAVEGSFLEPVLGRDRRAEFVGDLHSGSSPVLVMRQIEGDYTCCYQLHRRGDGYFGVWHDTVGRAGDVRLSPPVPVTETGSRVTGSLR